MESFEDTKQLYIEEIRSTWNKLQYSRSYECYLKDKLFLIHNNIPFEDALDGYGFIIDNKVYYSGSGNWRSVYKFKYYRSKSLSDFLLRYCGIHTVPLPDLNIDSSGW